MEREKFERVYEHACKRLSSIVPRKTRREKIRYALMLAGVKTHPSLWVGKVVLIALLAAIAGMLIPWSLFRWLGLVDYSNLLIPAALSLALALALPLAVVIVFYLYVYYLIETRAGEVEKVLPDFLFLVASNVNAGMTPFAAFRSAARSEFGVLTEGVKHAASKSLGTASFSEALRTLSKRVSSRHLKEVVGLFSQSLRSGGHLSKLLESSAVDLRQTQEMKKELLSSTRMYVLFVAFAMIIATPLLLAISVQFLEMIVNIQEQTRLGASSAPSVGFLASDMQITPEFMTSMAYVLMAGNSLLGSLFMGLLLSGKEKLGIKYFLPMFLLSAFFFGVFQTGLGGFLGVE